MAPLTAWLPARSSQDFDLIVKIVGPGTSVLLKEWAPIAKYLVDRGFAVMAQTGRSNGDMGAAVLAIRIAARPFFSMGHGCDVLVHLTDAVPDFRYFNLQPGSMLLWEVPAEPRLSPTLPEGVIAYPIPLVEFSTQCAEGLLGKGVAALGALLHFALRHQSIDLCDLGDMIRRRNALATDTAAPDHPDSAAATEQDEDGEADVGFVAWGAAQGVVRDAVALCRSFGLRVAGFYPKLIVPFPNDDMEAFAKTVGRVVLVESGETQGYWDRLRRGFSFEPTVLTPHPGTSLTLMDIFLREGLGAV